MKQLLTAIVLLIGLSTYSQCWIPQCSTPTTLYGTVNNRTFGGDPCITGTNTIILTKSCSFASGWKYINLNGTIQVQPDINMGPDKKIYTNQAVYLAGVSMWGNDTIYAAGYLSFTRVTGFYAGNVIMLASGISSILVGSTTYHPGDVINGNVQVLQCANTGTLPIKIGSFNAVKNSNGDFVITFETTDNSTTKFFNVWVTVDGIRKKIAVELPEPGKHKYSILITKDQVLK